MNNILESVLRVLPYKVLLILVLPLVVLEPLYKELTGAWNNLHLRASIKRSLDKWKQYWKEDLWSS